MVQGAYKASFSSANHTSDEQASHDAMMKEYNDVLNEVKLFGDRQVKFNMLRSISGGGVSSSCGNSGTMYVCMHVSGI